MCISEDDWLYYRNGLKFSQRTGRETNSKTAAFQQENAEARLDGAKETEKVRD